MDKQCSWAKTSSATNKRGFFNWFGLIQLWKWAQQKQCVENNGRNNTIIEERIPQPDRKTYRIKCAVDVSKSVSSVSMDVMNCDATRAPFNGRASVYDGTTAKASRILTLVELRSSSVVAGGILIDQEINLYFDVCKPREALLGQHFTKLNHHLSAFFATNSVVVYITGAAVCRITKRLSASSRGTVYNEACFPNVWWQAAVNAALVPNEIKKTRRFATSLKSNLFHLRLPVVSRHCSSNNARMLVGFFASNSCNIHRFAHESKTTEQYSSPSYRNHRLIILIFHCCV